MNDVLGNRVLAWWQFYWGWYLNWEEASKPENFKTQGQVYWAC